MQVICNETCGDEVKQDANGAPRNMSMRSKLWETCGIETKDDQIKTKQWLRTKVIENSKALDKSAKSKQRGSAKDSPKTGVGRRTQRSGWDCNELTTRWVVRACCTAHYTTQEIRYDQREYRFRSFPELRLS